MSDQSFEKSSPESKTVESAKKTEPQHSNNKSESKGAPDVPPATPNHLRTKAKNDSAYK